MNWSDCELVARARVRVRVCVWCLMSLTCLFSLRLWLPSSAMFPPCDLIGTQSFSFSQKRAHCCTDTQEEMRYEGSQVTAPPITR